MKLRLRARTGVVRDARHGVADWAAESGACGEDLRTLSLLTSELVSNAVEHGPADGEITVDARREPSGFRVAVTDQSSRRPIVRQHDANRIRGRGMQLVDLLSADWGVVRSARHGKCVWFLVAA